jgi:hypothetical protein
MERNARNCVLTQPMSWLNLQWGGWQVAVQHKVQGRCLPGIVWPLTGETPFIPVTLL